MSLFNSDICCFCGSSYSNYNWSPLIFTTASTVLFTFLKLKQHPKEKDKKSFVKWIIEQNLLDKLSKETQTGLEGEYTIINSGN